MQKKRLKTENNFFSLSEKISSMFFSRVIAKNFIQECEFYAGVIHLNDYLLTGSLMESYIGIK